MPRDVIDYASLKTEAVEYPHGVVTEISVYMVFDTVFTATAV